MKKSQRESSSPEKSIRSNEVTASTSGQPLVPLQVIRTETVISRLPIHNLVKGGEINIQISQKNEQGKINLHWEVSPSSRFGHPGQLAYKLDTVVINRLIDEVGRPVPKLLKIGTLNQLSQELGSQKNELKQALRQNAATTISAKLDYKGKDGQERKLEAIFARYSVVFTGETLPNGEKADEIYIIFNDPYLEVLNSAPVRPLNYDYLKELSPTAQRFYEIVSYRIYAALKYQHPTAKLTYSEYCTYSAQRRHQEFERMRVQMYRVHKPHLESHYLAKVEFQELQTEDEVADWLILYTPGLKAKAEYEMFHRKVLGVGKPQFLEPAGLEPSPASDVLAAKLKNPLSTSLERQQEASTNTLAALRLVQYFHLRARGKTTYVPAKGGKEIQQAAALLAAHDETVVQFLVDFAVREARKTNFQMKTFGALLQYVEDGLQAQARAAVSEEVAGEQPQKSETTPLGSPNDIYSDTYERAEQQLQLLPAAEFQALYDQVKGKLLTDYGDIVRRFDEATLERTIRAGMRSTLSSS
jgi:hypothetical protein